jgi:hypothetical protein
VVERRTPTEDQGWWWDALFGHPPFPVVSSWSELPGRAAAIAADWPRSGNRVASWWAQEKRRVSRRVLADLDTLGVSRRETVADQVTVVMVTSPIPTHPDTWVIDETLSGVRAQDELAGVEVLVLADGVPEHLAHMTRDYEAALQRLMVDHRGENVVVVRHDEHLHQAEMTRRALESIDTPLVLFVEHDTPLTGTIPWGDLVVPILAGQVDHIRMHYGTEIGDYHRHLMLADEPRVICGVPLMRTAQWSQRPHLAATAYYRDILGHHFAPGVRSMIEDVMHGVVQDRWRRDGERGWHRHRLSIYHPDGSILRSLHTDGRKTGAP